MAKKALVINGPNLNMLGKREPSIYGSLGYEALSEEIKKRGNALGLAVTIRQSNHEGELVDIIQNASNEADVIIINPGAYTHTSIAIRDALLAAGLPVIEAHMSNIYNREQFRRISYVSDIAVGAICGFGAQSYYLALEAAAAL
ncbi:3-dehydroquinate dehydratase II [hydrothermal vent metagenome]|uniref:3-dehydroquinate dehydratase n=1 Tax=hydrothermal vent metagenome TaxID=652676 RepID=A0A3B1BCF1_9ZZZZ